MNRYHLVGTLCALMSAFTSTPTAATGLTYLAPGWTATPDFHTLAIPTRAIEFDAAGNLYIEDTTDDGTGTVEILKLDASSGYSTSTAYVAYSTSYYGVTGLDFDGLGSLYVSERDTAGDAGSIREVDVAAQALLGDLMAFANHRPTGADADTSGNVCYTGRKGLMASGARFSRLTLLQTERL